MNIIDAIVLGLVQGITAFLPISSSGHLIVARRLLNLNIPNTLSFDVFLNTATLFAVIYCFWGDIKRICIDFSTSGFSSRSINLIYAIVLGTIPAVLVGFLYGDKIENTFRTAEVVAYALILGSILMFFADFINKKFENRGGINPIKGFLIGIFQSLALIPGISRSGATISGGLLSKLSREEAIRFSFLLYIPVSLGALLKTILDSSDLGFSSFFSAPYILGFIVALFSGIYAIKFMVNFLSKNSFTIFIIYRIIFAILILTLLH